MRPNKAIFLLINRNVQRVLSPYLAAHLIGVTTSITPIGIVTLNQIKTVGVLKN